MTRIFIGGIVGGIAMFLWGFVAHMVLQVGVDAFKPLDPVREAAAMVALKTAFPESGLYYLPYMKQEDMSDEAKMKDYESRHEAGPIALVLIERDGAAMMPPSMLVKEFISNVLAALIVACMAGMMTGAYLKRAFAVAGFGAVGWLSISASDMIWYRFPVETFIGEGIEQIAGWLIVGFVIAKLVPAARA
jgi:hypothetical protein